jgi:rubrerythrin
MTTPSPRTSAQWWNEIKRDANALIVWLRKQYQGEMTAAERIERYCTAALPAGDHRRRVLRLIAEQERTHAAWVGHLLRTRGEEPRVIAKTDRYWERALAGIRSFEDAAGIAHHAETMRLERIAVIATDEEAPEDIRLVFARILRDERFHARAFARLAGEPAITRTRSAHRHGAAAIGFVSAAEAV